MRESLRKRVHSNLLNMPEIQHSRRSPGVGLGTKFGTRQLAINVCNVLD